MSLEAKLQEFSSWSRQPVNSFQPQCENLELRSHGEIEDCESISCQPTTVRPVPREHNASHEVNRLCYV
jgi:hypothetical protein